MLAVDTLKPHFGLSQITSFPNPSNSRLPKHENIVRHPPRKASLAGGNTLKSTATQVATSPPSIPIKIPRSYKDIKIDHWTRKIFSIISNGPAGGFVSYAISPANELFVDRTGNRAAIEDVAGDLLPSGSCRYIAYKLRYVQDEQDKMKMIWIMWTPKEVQQSDMLPFLNGLAGTLIGLNCPSSIPLIEAKATEEVSMKKIMSEITRRRPSTSTSSSASSKTTVSTAKS